MYHSLDSLIKECQSKFNVSCSVIRKWWKNYEQYGELYYETMAHLQSIRKKYKWLPKRAKINEADLQKLKEIIDRQPDLYLDELALVFGVTTGKYVHHSTLWRYITDHLHYSLQCLTERALQQSQVEREDFKHSLQLLLQDNPELIAGDGRRDPQG